MLCCSCEDWALQSFPRAQLEWQEASLWDLCSSDPSSRTRFNLFQAWGAVKKSFFEKQKPIPKRLSCTWMWLQSLNFKVEKAKLQCCLIRNKSLSQLIISDTFAIWAPISVSWLFTYYFFFVSQHTSIVILHQGEKHQADGTSEFVNQVTQHSTATGSHEYLNVSSVKKAWPVTNELDFGFR